MGEAAPLLDAPQDPVPTGGQAEWFKGADGARLRAAIFPAIGPARGSVVLSPGRTEPLEKYFETICELQQRGFVVLTHDWRGQGRSARWLEDPQKSHARGWRPFLADFNALLKTYAKRLPKPWIALGHSMGGGLTVLALTEGEKRFSAAVLSSPMLGLRLGGRPAQMVRVGAWLMTLFGQAGEYVYDLKKRQAELASDGMLLTHNRTRWARYWAQIEAAPELLTAGFTWGWLFFALTLTLRIERLNRVERIEIPLVFVAAQHDHLCTNKAQRSVAARARRGRYIEVSGAYHEVLMETEDRRAVFWDAFDTVADEVAPAHLVPALADTAA